MGTQQPIGPRAAVRGRRYPLRPIAAAISLLAFAEPALADPVTHVVTTCDDAQVQPACGSGDDGTLRQALFCAQDQDTVDLSQLQCSTITLAAPLLVGPISVSLIGPEPQLTIDAGNQFRAIVHKGRPVDQLAIQGLSIANGRYVDTYTAGNGGGCIYSSGDVQLFGVDVHSCYASATNAIATGGAILARGKVSMLASTVTSSTVHGPADTKYASARGGGVAASTVEVIASTISGNHAISPGTTATYGGGIYAQNFSGAYSTISGNSATRGAGVAAGSTFTLSNSTISGNTASDADGGAKLLAGTAYLDNSTIAFNSAGGGAGGISAPFVVAYSTIVANNTAGGAAADIVADAGIGGESNLVMAANTTLPGDTITADPHLGPLQDNGGFTPTHALLPDSPAIDHGIAFLNNAGDQRFEPRVSNGTADIGAFEFDRIFGNRFD